MDSFKGKRILVTGGSEGIGRGIVIELWRQGADVATVSNQPEELERLRREYTGVRAACVDLRDWAATRAAVDALGVFDGLVNNAGIIILEPFLEYKPTSFDHIFFYIIFSVNVRAILNVSQIVAQKMIDNGIKGSIVNMSSKASKVGLKGHVGYCASKSALDAMTRVMALELGAHGIRVNAVNPTAINAGLGARVLAERGLQAEFRDMLARVPLGRFGELNEVVDAVLFLLGARASMVSGVQLPVDGGFLAT